MANQVKVNKKNIQMNRRKVFEAEIAVSANRTNAYATRSMIEENRAMIMRNYMAAFMGNRQLANQNTDDIFRNRRAIISNIKTSNDKEDNFKESMLNEANIDYLDHRSSLNKAVLEVNDKMIEVNRMLIEINSMIMKSNEGIVSFNAKNLEINKKLITGGISAKNATPASNAKRVKNNSTKVAVIAKRAKGNQKTINQIMSAMSANRSNIQKNGEMIMK